MVDLMRAFGTAYIHFKYFKRIIKKKNQLKFLLILIWCWERRYYCWRN